MGKQINVILDRKHALKILSEGRKKQRILARHSAWRVNRLSGRKKTYLCRTINRITLTIMEAKDKFTLGLELPTDPRWINIAEKNIHEILIDHAYCEQKAASS